MEEKRNLRKERIGVVSSNKGDKTITVTIKWKEKHPIYGKFVNKQRVQRWRHRSPDGDPPVEQDQEVEIS